MTTKNDKGKMSLRNDREMADPAVTVHVCPWNDGETVQTISHYRISGTSVSVMEKPRREGRVHADLSIHDCGDLDTVQISKGRIRVLKGWTDTTVRDITVRVGNKKVQITFFGMGA